ncbi:MAG: hypothetical protein DCE90_06495 [Pseudanabaena sp.]|nr:MAG: hypothetical protein DCE90_06495 [Pseudanabaena sp.]
MTTSSRQTDEKINKSHGHTVDSEGLLNNYAIEPEIYLEDGNSVSELTDRITVVDIFESEDTARSAVSAMEAKGLQVNNISIIAKGYKEPKHSLNWANIVAEGGLELMLTKLGIEKSAITKFVEAIDSGKFLVIEIGSDREASQVQHVLEEVGHKMQTAI